MYKFLQRKPKILSPRVVVQPYLSWQSRLASIIIGCSLLLLLSWGMYEMGRLSANLHENVIEEKLAYLFDPGTCRQTKKQKLCTQIGDLIQQLQISNAANQDLAEEMKFLANENDQLKEKLEFFRYLIDSNTKSGISIYQFSLKETQMPGEYRYALTLIQGGERPNDFKGNLRFTVKLTQNNRSKVIPLTKKNMQQDFPITFKFFHRLEDSFKAPPNSTVEYIQVEIYRKGNKKAILSETAQPTL